MSDKTLYQRLGGYDAIVAVVNDLFASKLADKELSRFFVGMGTDSRKRVHQKVVNFLCQATGGPCFYDGRDLRTVHTGLNITEEDWQKFVQIATKTMDKFNVPQKEREEVFGAVSSLKNDIVGI